MKVNEVLTESQVLSTWERKLADTTTKVAELCKANDPSKYSTQKTLSAPFARVFKPIIGVTGKTVQSVSVMHIEGKLTFSGSIDTYYRPDEDFDQTGWEEKAKATLKKMFGNDIKIRDVSVQFGGPGSHFDRYVFEFTKEDK